MHIITIVLLTVAIALMAIIVDRVIAVIFLQQQADATTNNDTCTSNNSNTTCNNQYTNGYSNNTMPFILPFP